MANSKQFGQGNESGFIFAREMLQPQLILTEFKKNKCKDIYLFSEKDQSRSHHITPYMIQPRCIGLKIKIRRIYRKFCIV